MLSIIKGHLMPKNTSKKSYAEFRCQSPADRFFGPKIPLSAGLAKSYQGTDLTQIIVAGRVLFGS
jgi:hypothetical protein